MPERDDELEKYLRGGSKLTGAWREAGNEEPGADLDEVIIEAARREVRKGPKVAYSPFSRSWGVPLALAAVLVVSVTVTLVMHEEATEPLPVPMDGPPGARAPEAKPPVAPGKAEAQRAPAPASREHARPDSREREASPREAPPAPYTVQAPAPPAESAVRKQALPSAPEAQRKERDAAAAAAPAKLEDAGRAPEMTPEQWLAKIEELRRQGKQSEADALLAEFKKRFPDYPLPSRSE
jgi:hypothetical protein